MMKTFGSKSRSALGIIVSLSLLAGISSLSRANPGSEVSVFLPVIVNRFPFIPSPPILMAIENTDGDGNYTVSWSASEGANLYTLEEDDNGSFSSPIRVYEGGATTRSVSGKNAGIYYYRVKAAYYTSSSGWSNIEQVSVTQDLPDCPRTGLWRGNTSQAKSIKFVVADSPGCQIVSNSLTVYWRTFCGDGITSFLVPFNIGDQKFDASGVSDKLVELKGVFQAADLAEGTFKVDYVRVSPYEHCTSTGTWDAHPLQGVDGQVYALHIQNTDGKIILGGNFTHVNTLERNNIARLEADGSLDESFNADVYSSVHVIKQQSDGKILIGGIFDEVNGQLRNGIARLNPDGSLDPSFNPQLSRSKLNPRIYAIEVLTGGDILIGGEFNQVDGVVRNYIARLNPQGSLVPDFNANIRADSYDLVNAISVQEDNIYIGGLFIAENEEISVRNLARLHLDGSLDDLFAPTLPNPYLYDVKAIAVQAGDGKIIVLQGGNIFRLNSNGQIDSQYPTSAFPMTLAIKENGNIIVGGHFTDYVIELQSNFVRNPAFNPKPNNSVLAIAIQQDGKIVIGGEFINVSDPARDGIARIEADGTIDLSFDPGP
jgi:uncharacterized delta-60 repeat protein